MTKSWLTKKDIAADLGVHPNSIPRMVAEGRLKPPVRLSTTLVRWDAEEYRAWREAQIEARDRELAQLAAVTLPELPLSDEPARDGAITECGRAAFIRGVKA
jgi:predicted DNA-binding transcriptional regulator AlpA